MVVFLMLLSAHFQGCTFFFILAASQEVWKHLQSPELLEQPGSTERV